MLTRRIRHANLRRRVRDAAPGAAIVRMAMRTATQDFRGSGNRCRITEQKRLALGYLQDAWTEAHDGIEGDCLAQTALCSSRLPN